MASTADPSAISTIEEWTSSLGELVIPNSHLEDKAEKLGSGSYSQSTVIQKLNRARCVSKTIQTHLFSRSEFRKSFIEGSLHLSSLRHPNVVELLGVQLKEDGTPPSMVFEHLSLNLQSCLEKYPLIPTHTKYSMLFDVSKGLHYLHSRPSPITHGRVTATNVLLTAFLQAKISDPIRFGAQVAPSPDAPYEPPEEKPLLNGDIFCFGDLTIHVVLQQPPTQLKSKKSDEKDLTEVERREKYLDSFRADHKDLKDLCIKCLEDNPILRPTASSLARDLDKMVASGHSEYNNVLDMYHDLQKLTLSKETIESLNRTIQGKEVEIEALKQQMEPLHNDIAAKDECLREQIQEVDSYKQALQAKEGRIRAHESGNRAKEALIKAKDREIAAKKQDVAAKESLLRASQKRIEALEQQVSALRKGVDIPMSPTTPGHDMKPVSRSVSGSPAQSPAPENGKPEVVYRKNKGRIGRNIVSDGFAYQDAGLRRTKSMSASEYDPVLASILARQHQRIEEAETINENQEKKTNPPPVRPKRPRASSLTHSELQNLIQKPTEGTS